MFALSSPLASWAASTWTVTDCTDDPSSGYAANQIGSLRFVVMHAASGDTIDLKHLPLNCSTISLQNGAIAISQDDLTLNGPGRDALTITGKDSPQPDRILNHTGAGALYLKNLSIAYGNPQIAGQTLAGGCILSSSQYGSVFLHDVSVEHCEISSADQPTFGGGVAAAGPLTLLHSNVSFNMASGIAPVAGGVFSGEKLQVKYSTITENSVHHTGNVSIGVPPVAGLFTASDLVLDHSTVSNNIAEGSYTVGGVECALGTSSAAASISNSTISGNAGSDAGGMLLLRDTITIRNSTIAFNLVANANGTGAGASVLAPAGTVLLESTLISNNSRAGSELDFSASPQTIINGGGNLVVSSTVTLPPDTIPAKPFLGPLQNNGGPTLTHALLPGSPGIGVGLNTKGFATDQRGPGYLRSTSTGTTDIGAFEFDAIFWNGLE
jgi:hypothetical protein